MANVQMAQTGNEIGIMLGRRSFRWIQDIIIG